MLHLLYTLPMLGKGHMVSGICFWFPNYFFLISEEWCTISWQFPKCRSTFSGIGIPIVNIRWSWDSLIFIMEIPILVRQHIYVWVKSTKNKSQQNGTECEPWAKFMGFIAYHALNDYENTDCIFIDIDFPTSNICCWKPPKKLDFLDEFHACWGLCMHCQTLGKHIWLMGRFLISEMFIMRQ